MDKIGKYKIIRRIGVGGMATVFLVEDTLMSRPFAMKILHQQFIDNEGIRQRFIQEARLQIALNHPNIIRCFDVDYQENYYYILLEYIEGPSLADILKMRKKNLPVAVVISIFSQILAGIDYAHRQAVIHRDVKPHNILIPGYKNRLSETDLAKIGDFGIAKALGGTSHTRTGTKLGTIFYMSPEQVLGSKVIDYRTDIYSLGITLYQMLTNHLPYNYTSNEFSVMESIVKKPIIPPGNFKKDIPDWLTDALYKATEKSPSDRFQSCKQFLNEIERGLNKADIPVPGAVRKRIPERKEKGIEKEKTPIRETTPVVEDSSLWPTKNHWVLVSVISGAVIIMVLLFIFQFSRSTTAMPDLINRPVSEALQQLEKVGIQVSKISKTNTGSMNSGLVLSSDPPPGAQINDENIVELTLSFNTESNARFKPYFTGKLIDFLNEKRLIIRDFYFAENFNSNKNRPSGSGRDQWQLDDQANIADMRITDGQLLIARNSGNTPLLVGYPGENLADCIIRIDVQTDPSRTSSPAGIFLEIREILYTLLVDPAGKRYFTGYYDSAGWQGDWVDDRNQILSQPSTIEVGRYRASLDFFINGVFVKNYSNLSVPAVSLDAPQAADEEGEGDFGLIVPGTHYRVGFDNLVICLII